MYEAFLFTEFEKTNTMTEHIFTGILEDYRKEEISIEKAKRQIKLLLDHKNTSDVVDKNDLLHDVVGS